MARVTNPFVALFRKQGIPRELRMMAAQGVFPLRLQDLVELLAILAGDADPQVREEVSKTIMAFAAASRMSHLEVLGTSPFHIGDQLAPEAPLSSPARHSEASEVFEDIPCFGAASQQDAIERVLSEEERAQSEVTSALQRLSSRESRLRRTSVWLSVDLHSRYWAIVFRP